MPRRKVERFKPGDLVFAKMKGFPHWPARVCKSEDGYNKRVPVFFFGTHQLGQIPPQNIVPFVGNKLKYGGGSRNKGFAEGMWEIQNTPGIGNKLKVPVKFNTHATPSKPTPAATIIISNLRSTPSKSPTKPDSKTASGRSTPSKFMTEKEITAASKSPSRASLRSASDKESNKTSEKSSAAEEITTTETVVKRRGRKKKIRTDSSAPAGRSTGLTTTSIPSTKNEKEKPEEIVGIQTPSKTPVSKTAPDTEKQTPAAKTTTTHEATAEKETRSSVKAPTKATDKPTSENVELLTDPEEDAAPTTRSKRVDSKSDDKRRKNTSASPAVATPVSKKRRTTETRSAPRQTSQNDTALPEYEERMDNEEKKGKRLLESQGLKRKRDKETDEKEVQKKAKEKSTEEKKEDSSGSQGVKRRKVEDVKHKRLKRDESVERKGDIAKEKTEEKPSESHVMRTRRAEKEEQKEVKQDEDDRRTEETRETGLESEGRKGMKEKGVQQKTKDVAVGKKQVIAGTNESQGIRKKRWEKKKEEAQKKNKYKAVKDQKGEEILLNKTEEDTIEEKSDKVGKTRKPDEEGQRKGKYSYVDAKKKGRKKKEERREIPEADDNETGGSSVDAERQHRLAAKRESVLKSLRGLLKAGKIVKRRETTKATQKAGDGAKKKGNVKYASDRKSVTHSTVSKVISKKSGVRGYVKKRTEKEEKNKPEEKESLKKEESRKVSSQKTTAERKKEEEKTEQDRKTEKTNQSDKRTIEATEELRTKDKESRQQCEDKLNTEVKKDEESKQQKDEGKKDERKIIGKIVKATTKQGTKVLVKTMMGRSMVPAAEDEKKAKEEKMESLKNVDEKKKSSDKMKEKNGEKDRKIEKGKEAEGKSEGKKAATENRKDPNITEAEKKGKEEDEKQRTCSDPKINTNEEQEQKATSKPQERKKEAETEEQTEAKHAEAETTPQKKGEKATAEGEDGSAETSRHKDVDTGEQKTSTVSKTGTDSSDEASVEQAQPEAKKAKSSTMTLTDSTLHRIHGDIRISLKSDNPDISKCLKALDQLSMVYVTSQHVQRHSELVATLRQMRFYRANQAIMDKASMLYNRFKNAFLVGDGEEVVSATFLRSLLEEKEREEEQRVEHCRENPGGDEKEGKKSGGGGGEETSEGARMKAEGGEGQAAQTEGPLDSS